MMVRDREIPVHVGILDNKAHEEWSQVYPESCHKSPPTHLLGSFMLEEELSAYQEVQSPHGIFVNFSRIQIPYFSYGAQPRRM